IHGRIWRITAKGRPLLRPPALSGAPVPRLIELLGSPDRWPLDQAKRMFFGLETLAVTTALLSWYEKLDAQDPASDFAVIQALGVFESHDVVEVPLLRRALTSQRGEVRAFAVEALARWAERMPADFQVHETLRRLAGDTDDRVRLAVAVAAGNIP